MVVVIRDQTLTCAVLGTSNPVTITCVAGPLHFDFPSPVPLIPGHTYVIQPIADDFDYWDMRINGGIDVYAAGRAVRYDGEAVPGNDFWFREGPVTPVPVQKATWGAIKTLYR